MPADKTYLLASDPVPPFGAEADALGEWQLWDGELSRLCWSARMRLPEHLSQHDIRAVAQQRPDGSLMGDPLVFLDELGFEAADARLVAWALLSAAKVATNMSKPVESHGGVQ